MFYSSYLKSEHPQSVGKVLAYLEMFLPIHIVERVTIGDNKISYPYEGAIFATYTWTKENIPVFHFQMHKDTRKTSLIFSRQKDNGHWETGYIYKFLPNALKDIAYLETYYKNGDNPIKHIWTEYQDRWIGYIK